MSRGLGDVYKRQTQHRMKTKMAMGMETIHKEIIQMNSLRMIHNGMILMVTVMEIIPMVTILMHSLPIRNNGLTPMATAMETI